MEEGESIDVYDVAAPLGFNGMSCYTTPDIKGVHVEGSYADVTDLNLVARSDTGPSIEGYSVSHVLREHGSPVGPLVSNSHRKEAFVLFGNVTIRVSVAAR